MKWFFVGDKMKPNRKRVERKCSELSFSLLLPTSFPELRHHILETTDDQTHSI